MRTTNKKDSTRHANQKRTPQDGVRSEDRTQSHPTRRTNRRDGEKNVQNQRISKGTTQPQEVKPCKVVKRPKDAAAPTKFVESKSIRIPGEIFTWADAKHIATIDAASYFDAADATGKQAYAISNQFGYYSALNAWILILIEMTHGDPLYEITSFIQKRGLVHTILLGSTASDCLISGKPLPPNPFTYFIRHMTEEYSERCEEMDSVPAILQGLRFLKRFSPLRTDSLIEQEVRAFKKRNTSMRMFNQTEIEWKHTQGVKEILADVFSRFDAEYRKELEYTDLMAYLPTGACCDTTGRSLSHKLLAVEKYIFNFCQAMPHCRSEINASFPASRYCEIHVVPKSFKARRVIAEEQCYRQTSMARVQNALTSCLTTSNGKYGSCGQVVIEDQSLNQEAAYRGSIDNSLATIDLTAASDSVSAAVVRSVFPASVVRLCDELRSEKFTLPKTNTYQTLHMYSSMGSRLTFPLETALFWAIVCYACEIASLFRNEAFDKSQIFVYGDDCIMPSQYYETCIDMLRKFGFTPNLDKSFGGTEFFRESCGVEYLHGATVSSRYFPRKEISDDIDGVIRLISLQQKLSIRFRRSSQFVSQVVLNRRPSVKTTAQFTHNNSLWDAHPSSEFYAHSHLYKTKADYERAICHPLFCEDDYIAQTVAVSKYSDTTDPVLIDASERIAYVSFLKNGPRYACALDAKDGISEPPISRQALRGTATSNLTTSYY